MNHIQSETQRHSAVSSNKQTDFALISKAQKQQRNLLIGA